MGMAGALAALIALVAMSAFFSASVITSDGVFTVRIKHIFSPGSKTALSISQTVSKCLATRSS